MISTTSVNSVSPKVISKLLPFVVFLPEFIVIKACLLDANVPDN